jgi:WD40 repeat protein
VKATNRIPRMLCIVLLMGCLIAAVQGIEPSWTYSCKEGVKSIAVSANGSAIAVGADRTYLFDGNGTRLFENYPGTIVQISSDGQVISSTVPYGIAVYLQNGKILWENDIRTDLEGLSMTSDGAYVATLGSGKIIRYNNTGVPISDIGGVTDAYSLTLTADGDAVFVGRKNLIDYYDRKGDLSWNYIVPGSVRTLALSASNGRIAAVADNAVLLLSRHGYLFWKYTTPGPANLLDVAITANASAVVAGGQNNAVYLFNGTGNLSWSYPVGDWIRSVDISATGEYIVAGSIDKTIYAFNRDGVLLWSYKTDGWIDCVAISSDGQTIVAGTRTGKVLTFRQSSMSIWAPERPTEAPRTFQPAWIETIPGTTPPTITPQPQAGSQFSTIFTVIAMFVTATLFLSKRGKW